MTGRGLQMDLDALTTPQASEKLSSRLWRRYGAEIQPLVDALGYKPAPVG